MLLRGVADLQGDRYVSNRILDEARGRIVQLYTAWKRPADADAWRQHALR